MRTAHLAAVHSQKEGEPKPQPSTHKHTHNIIHGSNNINKLGVDWTSLFDAIFALPQKVTYYLSRAVAAAVIQDVG